MDEWARMKAATVEYQSALDALSKRLAPVIDQMQMQLDEAKDKLIVGIMRADAEDILNPPSPEEEVRRVAAILSDKTTYQGIKPGNWDAYAKPSGNIDRAQLAKVAAYSRQPGWGYLPFVRVEGAWGPAGMRVWNTAYEAVEHARANYAGLDDVDIRAQFVHPSDEKCQCVLNRGEPLAKCRRCGGVGRV